jgi:Ca2+-transporting ATPase
MPFDEVEKIYEANRAHGLSLFDVGHRQKEYGPNSITARKRQSPLIRFLLQFNQPLMYILLGAGLITALLQEWVDAGVIIGVVLVNAVVGFLQEAKAEEAIESLKRMVTTEATVLREGKKLRIPSAELVPGDVVLQQQLGFTYLPLMNRLFHTAPISFAHWGQIAGACLAAMVVVTVDKRFASRYSRA